MWKKKLEITGPYDFSQVLTRLSLDPINHVDLTKKMIKVPLIIHQEPVIAEIQSTGTREAPSFIITAKNDETEVLEKLREIFQWNVSLKAVNEHFTGTILNHLFLAHEGTPLILDFDPYHCLMKCIIHQQLNLKFAYKLVERFVHNFGTQIDGVWFYPTPEKIAKLDYQDLRELQFSMRKAEYVIDTSKLIANGTLNLEEINKLSNEEIIKELVKIRGIGVWTVQNYLLFGLGRQNLFPMADVGIQNALKKLLNLTEKPTFEQMEQLSVDWSPYLSYASLYLWRSLEN